MATLTGVASSISIASAQPGGGASEHAPIAPEVEECSADTTQSILKDYSSNGQALSTADCERLSGGGGAGAAEMSRVPGWGSVFWKCIKKMCGYADDVPKKPKSQPDLPDGPQKPKGSTDVPDLPLKKQCGPPKNCSAHKAYCMNLEPDERPNRYKFKTRAECQWRLEKITGCITKLLEYKGNGCDHIMRGDPPVPVPIDVYIGEYLFAQTKCGLCISSPASETIGPDEWNQ